MEVDYDIRRSGLLWEFTLESDTIARSTGRAWTRRGARIYAESSVRILKGLAEIDTLVTDG